MANLFEKAKQNGSKKVVEKHEVVNIPQLEDKLLRLIELNEKMAELEAERDIIDSEVRHEGKQAMINLYNAKKSFPGTIKIKAGTTGFQFITSDRYKKVDEEGSVELVKLYGKDIIEEVTVYSFNTAILVKHMEHISELLMNSTQLSDEDKETLLESETSYSIKKGTIKNLFSFKKVKTVDTIIEHIQPVFSVKSVQKD